MSPLYKVKYYPWSTPLPYPMAFQREFVKSKVTDSPIALNSIYAPGYAITSEKNDKNNQKKLFYQNRNISLIVT